MRSLFERGCYRDRCRGIGACQAPLGGFDVDIGKDTAKIEYGGKDRVQEDSKKRNTGELRHDEHARTHDGRHQCTADAGGGLDRPRLHGAESMTFHQRDGDRAGGHRIGTGASRHHAHQCAGHHRHLGRPAHETAS